MQRMFGEAVDCSWLLTGKVNESHRKMERCLEVSDSVKLICGSILINFAGSGHAPVYGTKHGGAAWPDGRHFCSTKISL